MFDIKKKNIYQGISSRLSRSPPTPDFKTNSTNDISVDSDDDSILDEIYLGDPPTPEVTIKKLPLGKGRKIINPLPTGDFSSLFNPAKTKPQETKVPNNSPLFNSLLAKPPTDSKKTNISPRMSFPVKNLPGPIKIPPFISPNQEFSNAIKFTDQLTPNPPLGSSHNSFNRSTKVNSNSDTTLSKDDITNLLSKIHYNTKEWLPLYQSKVVQVDFTQTFVYIKNISRKTIQELTDKGKLARKYPILNEWIVCIVKDTYADLYVVANLWYLWYNDRLFHPEDSEDDDTEVFIAQQLTRKSHSLKIPDEDSCEYNFLLNSFLIIRRKSLRLTWDHKVEVDLKPSVKGVKIIWDEIWLPLLFNMTKRILNGKLDKPTRIEQSNRKTGFLFN